MMGIKRPGGFAELSACRPARRSMPAGLKFHEAAVVMRHAPMAWNLMINTCRAREPGETVLIMGAGVTVSAHRHPAGQNVVGAT